MLERRWKEGCRRRVRSNEGRITPLVGARERRDGATGKNVKRIGRGEEEGTGSGVKWGRSGYARGRAGGRSVVRRWWETLRGG
jgi:hypothetical protein